MRTSLRLDKDRELQELREYLGEDYDHGRLERHEHQLLDEFAEVGDEPAFYRESQGYLYDLTAFAASGTKLPYLERLVAAIPPEATILDYGCGIGSDGMLLLEEGWKVAFADFDNPSTRYLKWRLERRGLDATLYDIDRDPIPPHDAVFCFDVIEHVPDPAAFLDRLSELADTVAVNFLEDEGGHEMPLHRELPVRRLLAKAGRGRIEYYGVHYGRSHLVIFRSEPAGLLDQARSLTKLASGRLRARLSG